MGSMIQDLKGKIKTLIGDQATFTAILLILVAIASFGLGRQSVTTLEEDSGQEVALVTAGLRPAVTERPIATSTNSNPMYVASKNGSVYHLLHCSGAKRINETNKIFFNTKAEAEAAGLRPAANCKGI